MSQSVAKATRRELRRAVGQHGLDLVQRHENFLAKQLAPSVNSLAQSCAVLSREHDKHKNEFQAFISRPFMERLRWIVLGR